MALDLENRVDFEYYVQTRFTTTRTWFYQWEIDCISRSPVSEIAYLRLIAWLSYKPSEMFFEGMQYFPFEITSQYLH